MAVVVFAGEWVLGQGICYIQGCTLVISTSKISDLMKIGDTYFWITLYIVQYLLLSYRMMSQVTIYFVVRRHLQTQMQCVVVVVREV